MTVGQQAAPPSSMQDVILALQRYWLEQGCSLAQPFNTEVGAGTMNPATLLRVLGPEPWRVAYVEPSVRPDDSRYGENPNRLQTHTQFQVILKPEPGDPQELYLGSLAALGIDIAAHDVRFVEDNWAQPAIGAWGLGWEVWLDGLEITQFTYFQQVGGQNLDPVAVELTYGLERIVMAMQHVTHFKDVVYAPGLTYGEIFGQSEEEMSKYYLDVATIDLNRGLYDSYIDEAQRLIDEGLPIPAHAYVLKSSHAFNVLDARGAISTTERARAFATMRRLARGVCALWLERREALGFPLLSAAVSPPEDREGEIQAEAPEPTKAETFALEVGVEELPPHVLDESLARMRTALVEGLAATRLDHGAIEVDGTPRRLVAVIADVSPREPDGVRTVKGPRATAAYDAQGAPTKALEGFARSRAVAVEDVVVRVVDGVEHVTVDVAEPGRSANEVLGSLVESLVRELSAERNMRWNDPELAFSRPIRWIVALLGSEVVPVKISSLSSGRRTYLQRDAAEPWCEIDSAGELTGILRKSGIVIDVSERTTQVIESAKALAATVGGVVQTDEEIDLVHEIANLVETPHGILGRFDDRYLELPEPVLVTVMRKHQRYLPVRRPDGALLPYFITMADGSCDDDVVRAGNEAVLRARYEDAVFFWQADLRVPIEAFRSRLEKLTFEETLGSVARRADRVRDVAEVLAHAVAISDDESATLRRAGELVKFDLSTQMVTELSSLAGTMAREYARKAGESDSVAVALFESELPRSSGDILPSSLPGALMSLADRADLLTAMMALGHRSSGSSDPYGLRRAALGVVRVLEARADTAEIDLRHIMSVAAERVRRDGIEVDDAVIGEAVEFAAARYEQLLRSEGIDPMLTPTVDLTEPFRARMLLSELAELRDDPRFAQLLRGLHRISRIVPPGTPATYLPEALADESDIALRSSVDALADCRNSSLRNYIDTVGDLAGDLDRFFDSTLVMAEDPSVRSSRLGLLQTVVERAPHGVRWGDLGFLTGTTAK